MKDNGYATYDEISKILNIEKQKLYNCVSSYNISKKKIGTKTLVNKNELLEFFTTFLKPNMICSNKEDNHLLSINEASRYLRLSPSSFGKLVRKGKIKKINDKFTVEALNSYVVGNNNTDLDFTKRIDFIRVKEAAKILNLTKGTIAVLCGEGKIKYFQPGGKWTSYFFIKSFLDEYSINHKKDISRCKNGPQITYNLNDYISYQEANKYLLMSGGCFSKYIQTGKIDLYNISNQPYVKVYDLNNLIVNNSAHAHNHNLDLHKKIKFINSTFAAKYLNTSISNISLISNQSKLKYFKIHNNGRLYFTKEFLDEYLGKEKIVTKIECKSETKAPNNTADYLTLSQLSNYIGVGKQRLCQLTKSNILNVYIVSGVLRYKIRDINEFIFGKNSGVDLTKRQNILQSNKIGKLLGIKRQSVTSLRGKLKMFKAENLKYLYSTKEFVDEYLERKKNKNKSIENGQDKIQSIKSIARKETLNVNNIEEIIVTLQNDFIKVVNNLKTIVVEKDRALERERQKTREAVLKFEKLKKILHE